MDVEDPGFKDLYAYGVVAEVKQVLRVPDELVKVLVEGKYRAKLLTLDSVSYTHLCIFIASLKSVRKTPLHRARRFLFLVWPACGQSFGGCYGNFYNRGSSSDVYKRQVRGTRPVLEHRALRTLNHAKPQQMRFC